MLETPNAARHVLISINPKAGRSSPVERANRLRDCLRRKGFLVELHTDLDVVSQRANELFSQDSSSLTEQFRAFR